MPRVPSEVLGVAPWVIIAAVVSWILSMAATRARIKKELKDQADRLEVHRDELTLQIIRAGREEIAVARIEVEDLRDEVKNLRAMETHFYHFQQSLEHLEALLTAATPEEREIAERNARGFLNRMRRLQTAKSTLANEAQRLSSEIEMLGDVEAVAKEVRKAKDTKNGDPGTA
jgi:archaellum component FlaC